MGFNILHYDIWHEKARITALSDHCPNSRGRNIQKGLLQANDLAGGSRSRGSHVCLMVHQPFGHHRRGWRGARTIQHRQVSKIE